MSKYRNTEKDLAVAFKALSNPHRLQIFIKLANLCKPGCSTSKEMQACISDAGSGLNIVPSTLSHHMKELKNADLVVFEKSGQKSVCTINRKTLRTMQKFFNDIGEGK